MSEDELRRLKEQVAELQRRLDQTGRIEERQCLNCGNTFRPQKRTGKYCSYQCYWEHKSRLSKEIYGKGKNDVALVAELEALEGDDHDDFWNVFLKKHGIYSMSFENYPTRTKAKWFNQWKAEKGDGE